MKDLLESLTLLAHTVQRIGSRVTCDPIPENSDEDYLALVFPSNRDVASGLLENSGFWRDSKYDYGPFEQFRSYRKDDKNIILCFESDFFYSFICATLIAKKLNLQMKEERISICRFLQDRQRDELFLNVAEKTTDELN